MLRVQVLHPHNLGFPNIPRTSAPELSNKPWLNSLRKTRDGFSHHRCLQASETPQSCLQPRNLAAGPQHRLRAPMRCSQNN